MAELGVVLGEALWMNRPADVYSYGASQELMFCTVTPIRFSIYLQA